MSVFNNIHLVYMTVTDSSIISQYPNLPEYPKFYNLGNILHEMYRGSTKIHPYTREMLSSLDQYALTAIHTLVLQLKNIFNYLNSWMREQHVLPGAVNSLFAPTIESRLKVFVYNPLFLPNDEDNRPNTDSPNKSTVGDGMPLMSSTPLSGAPETSTAVSSRKPSALAVPTAHASVVSAPFREHHPVDMIVKNPLFGSGLSFKKVYHGHIIL